MSLCAFREVLKCNEKCLLKHFFMIANDFCSYTISVKTRHRLAHIYGE